MRKFCTVINCMDGRVQIPANAFLLKRFQVDYVDTITEAGPNLILSEQTNLAIVHSIYNRLDKSVNQHGSNAIAIVGHYDCAGNPADEKEQCAQLDKCEKILQGKYPNAEIIKLWIDKHWQVTEL